MNTIFKNVTVKVFFALFLIIIIIIIILNIDVTTTKYTYYNKSDYCGNTPAITSFHHDNVVI
jgi:hypothetical protein